MSANTTGVYQAFYGNLKTCFYNSVPMANYLMAAVVGNFVETNVDSGTGGYPTTILSEPGLATAALAEFYNLQLLVNAVESFLAPVWYPFGFYRIVIMPPVYAMGGMANPCLAYTSATTITGTQSQEFVLVRNIAQMWVGALVTQNNWEDMWINEGLTTYIERFVMSSIDSLSYSQREAWVGNYTLWQQTQMTSRSDTFYSLHPVLKG